MSVLIVERRGREDSTREERRGKEEGGTRKERRGRAAATGNTKS